MNGRSISFLEVACILVAIPGPDFAAVLRNALVSSRHGILTALGTVSGLALHATAASLGLSAILLASAELFTVVKYAGAAFLLSLGVRALLGARKAPGVTGRSPAPPATLSRSYRQGLTINILNPKAPVIFLSVMPPFVDRAAAIAPQVVVLSAILVSVALVWYTVVALTVGRTRVVVTRYRRGISAATGVAFIAFGIRLALEPSA